MKNSNGRVGFNGSPAGVGDSDLIDLFSESEDQNLENLPTNDSVKFRSSKVKKVTPGSIVAMVFLGLVVSFVFFLVTSCLYTRYIRFPDEQERVWEESRLFSLQNFCDDVNDLEISVSNSYLMREKSYANKNIDRERFMKYVVASVSYRSDMVAKKNVYGNEYIDPESGEVTYERSWVDENEKVSVSFINYSQIVFDSKKVELLVSEAGLSANDIDYRNKLTDLFCRYIYGINVEELPKMSVERVPQLGWNGKGYDALLSEDIYLDKALFSSNSLYDCFERFAESVASILGIKLDETSEYLSWSSLNNSDKENTAMPLRYGQYSIGRTWCGSYYLLNEHYENGNKVDVAPQIGNGSGSQPAGVGTSVITYELRKNEEGSIERLPIRITLREFGVSQNAINWFQKKSIQNRGYDVTSEVQYCYFVFEITNLSYETLVIDDNSSLCDVSANCSSRTGIVYGLQSSVTLEPGETGVIESWSRSTELNLKYVIWGKDFARMEEPVWFRVLAGDLEDPSWNKGVYINNTRG